MKSIDFVTLIVTIITGVLAFLLGEALLGYFFGEIPDIILMGIYFASAGALIVFSTNLSAYRLSPLQDHIPVRKAFVKMTALFMIIALLVLFGFGTLFQFIYALTTSENTGIDNYVMAIDNSSSMEINDPAFQRYDALRQLVENTKPHQTIGIYCFSDYTRLVMESQSVDAKLLENFDSIIEPFKYNSGGTATMSAISDILDDIEESHLEGNTSIVIISDGECDVYEGVLDRCVALGIPVHTIAVNTLGVGNSLLFIAEKTNGKYYYINDIGELSGVIERIDETSEYHLVNKRSANLLDSLERIIMRTAFLFLLGLFVKILQAFSIDIRNIRRSIIFQGIIFSLAASTFIEFALKDGFVEHEGIARLVLIELFALLILKLPKGLNPIKRDNLNIKSFSDISLTDFSRKKPNQKGSLNRR